MAIHKRNAGLLLPHAQRQQYRYFPTKRVRIDAYSAKAGSTSLLRHIQDPCRIIAQPEVEALREDGVPVHLYVRHPLDRLVSAYTWFTTKHNSPIRPIRDKSPKDHDVILGKTEATFEQWVEVALRHPNPHWCSQTEYHTTPAGLFVPTHCTNLQFLGGKKYNEIARPSWTDYYTKDFEERMSTLFAADLELFNDLKEHEDGIDTRGRDVLPRHGRDVRV